MGRVYGLGVFIPLGIAEERRRATVVTWWLMGFTAVCMLGQQAVLRFGGPELYEQMIVGLGWESFSKPWGLVTYQFLHGDLMHIAGNMLFLWVFGVPVEERLGRWRFLAVYLLGGMAAGIAQSVVEPGSLTIGASGSVAAITGAFLVLAPRAPMRVLFFFLLIMVISIPAWWFIVFAIAKDFLLQTWSTANGGVSGVAHAAHLGGYAFGFGAAMLMLAKGWAERGPYNLFTMHRQARRRRAFKLAMEQTERSVEKAVARARRASEANPEGEAARSALVTLVQSGQMGEAVDAYRVFAKDYPSMALPRDVQLGLAQHLHGAGEHELAAKAFGAFVERSPNDREAPVAWLMLAILRGRYLSDVDGARKALGGVDRSRLGPGEKAMFEELATEFSFTEPEEAS